jgi:hypothetical protein
MNDNLRTLLGLMDDGKRVYRFEDGEVDREEFKYSQVMFNYLFDEEKGLVATLGPTWNMVHDPRFNKIENCFIRRRKNMFSPGETVIGQVEVDGAFAGFSNDVQQLEQYSTILGEGRHFREVILEGKLVDPEGDVCVPKTFHQEDDATIWNLVQQECPNYFYKNGKPNRDATRLFNLLKEDLVGLIDDYAEVPLANEWINSESHDVYEEDKWDGETPVIFLEVDQLEKALTVRGNLRVTAARVLDRLGFSKHIAGGERLTSAETDELLHIVYTSNWPDDRLELAVKIMSFVQAKNAIPFEAREREQLMTASERSKEVIAKIKSGELKQITKQTDAGEAESHVGLDAEAIESAQIIKEIQENPFKTDLFTMLVNAEASVAAENSRFMKEVYDREPALSEEELEVIEHTRELVPADHIVALLTPIFQQAGYVVDQQIFTDFVHQVRAIQGGGPRLATTVEQGGCEQKVPKYWNADIGAFSEMCRQPLPCPIHLQENTNVDAGSSL